jgi:molecular chaperone GrpE
MENLKNPDGSQVKDINNAQKQTQPSPIEQKDEDSVIDSKDVEPTAESNQIKELEDKLEICQTEMLKVAAELQNMRKRYESQIEETKKYAIANIAKEILSVMDNLGMALKNDNQDLISLQKTIAGVELTKTQLENIFVKFKIKKIEPKIGDPFDYELHHAVSKVPSDTQQENTIMQLMQVGYKIEDRLLRPALVSVASESA